MGPYLLTRPPSTNGTLTRAGTILRWRRSATCARHIDLSLAVGDAAQLGGPSREQAPAGVPDPAADAHQTVIGNDALVVDQQPLAAWIEMVKPHARVEVRRQILPASVAYGRRLESRRCRAGSGRARHRGMGPRSKLSGGSAPTRWTTRRRVAHPSGALVDGPSLDVAPRS